MRNDYGNRPRPSQAPKGKGPGGLAKVGGTEPFIHGKGNHRDGGASKGKTKGKLV